MYREGMVALWRNTLATSKQKTESSLTINLLPTQMTAPVKEKRFFYGVGVACGTLKKYPRQVEAET